MGDSGMASSIAVFRPFPASMPLTGVQEPRSRASSSPLVEFLFFHKAIRAELERLHQDALAVEKGSETEFRVLFDRYRFVRAIYKHHTSAEDEVIFPALDLRVKNVAQAYSLEHKVESKLFDQMSDVLKAAMKGKGSTRVELRRELVCCTEAIKTTLFQHLSKEEEQVFPLLKIHFSFDEQAALVWQFLCSIPVNLMEKFLPWLASSLTQEERHEMVTCLESIVPEEELLQQVVFAWLKGGSIAPEIKDQTKQLEKLVVISTTTMGGEGVQCPSVIRNEEPKDFDRKRCEPDIGQELSGIGSQSRSGSGRFPINELLYWHTAIRKELREFAEEARRLELSGSISSANLSAFIQRLQFLAEVCNFHSAAEDKILFPAVNQKVKHRVSFTLHHAQEEQQFDDVLRLLESLQSAGDVGSIPVQLYEKVCAQAESMVKSIKKHLLAEEIEVLPLARKHFSVEEQRVLLYQSLRVMPLKFLERVLPWLVGVLSEDEAKDMFQNMRLAAPVADKALVTLFTGWACKGHPKKISSTGTFQCISSTECPGIQSKKASTGDEQVDGDSLDSSETRPPKRLRGSRVEETSDTGSPGKSESIHAGFLCNVGKTACCVPGLGCSTIGAKTNMTSLRPLAIGSASPLLSNSLGSGLFGWGSPASTSGGGLVPKPIDHIFQFHKAIRKDLEYLDVESARLADCHDEFLRNFSGRFQFLWGLYRAHSNAEDDIVFPALEAKEALHNVSHSYTIDHKQEEQLFEDISKVLSELSQLHNSIHSISDSLVLLPSTSGVDSGSKDATQENTLKRRDLAGKLQRMCKSVRVSLDQHVSREELELWPLFDVHFTIEEQDKIVGQIIGTTGAEVLQSMLPWVTTALTEEEHNTMMDTWRQATRNTMFDKWLSAWWKDTPLGSPGAGPPTQESTVPPSGSDESLQLVADYLVNGATSSGDSEIMKGSSLNHQGLSSNNIVSTSEIPPSRAGCDVTADVSIADPSRDSRDSSTTHVQEKAVVGDGSETFKPGWRDIFRMNQKELEAAIRKVSSDSSLDPRRKAYLMQNLMTSRWIVAQQQLPNLQKNRTGDALQHPGQSQSFQDEEKKTFGCEHYKRNCKIRAACCGLLFTCRFCHDKVSDHSMDRHATKEMMCMKCLKVQPVGQHCATPSCNGFSMARYFCSICKFFDNDDRDIYHCPFCNLCRVGKGLGQDYFHCMTCNACMSMSLSVHVCREKGLESNCPICHDFLFTSSTPVKALPCGHFMHSACFKAYTCGHYTCPICSKSVGDMAVFFGMLDALLAAEQLPDEYQNRDQEILCNDCEKKGIAPFHWLYHKCQLCGSYNTRAI